MHAKHRDTLARNDCKAEAGGGARGELDDGEGGGADVDDGSAAKEGTTLLGLLCFRMWMWCLMLRHEHLRRSIRQAAASKRKQAAVSNKCAPVRLVAREVLRCAASVNLPKCRSSSYKPQQTGDCRRGSGRGTDYGGWGQSSKQVRGYKVKGCVQRTAHAVSYNRNSAEKN